MSITDARRPLFWVPRSNAVELADASVAASKLEADAGTSKLTLGVDGYLVSTTLVR